MAEIEPVPDLVAAQWKALQSRVASILAEVQSLGIAREPQIVLPSPRANREEIMARIIGIYGPQAPEVKLVFEQRLLGEQWPQLSWIEAHYAIVILQTVQRFLDGFLLWDGGKSYTIFPLPRGFLDNLVLWLVTDWWERKGLEQYAWDKSRDLEKPFEGN